VPQPEKQNDNATLFIAGKSRLHGLHPFNKLLYILLTGVIVYAGPKGWFVEIFLITLNGILALHGGVFTAAWRLLWRTLLPLALFMITIHGFLHPDNRIILLSFGWLHFYQEGFVFAINVLLQLSALLTASLLFVFCTHPADLISAISQAGWPPSLAYLLGSPLLLLPLMRARIRTIQAAQRSRGLHSEGNFVRRFLSLFPLVTPLVLGSLVEIEQRSIALEIRGFNTPGPKTSWRTIADSTGQQVARWTMFLLIILLFIGRIFR
jgi:energy-coupling factor transport system permease protein